MKSFHAVFMNIIVRERFVGDLCELKTEETQDINIFQILEMFPV